MAASSFSERIPRMRTGKSMVVVIDGESVTLYEEEMRTVGEMRWLNNGDGTATGYMGTFHSTWWQTEPIVHDDGRAKVPGAATLPS